MAALDTTSLSDEPALSGWWVVACLSAAALVLLFAALIQQASMLSDTLITITGGQAVQTTAPVGTQLEAPEVVGASTEDFTQLTLAEEFTVSAETENSDDVTVSNSLAEDADINVDEQTLAQSASTIVLNEVSEQSANEELSLPSAPAQSAIDDDVEDSSPINQELLASEERLDPQDSLFTYPEELPITELVEEQVVPNAGTTAIDELAAAPDITDPALVAPVLAEITPAESVESSESNASEESGELEELPSSSELSLVSLRRDVLTKMTQRSRLIRFETGTAELTPASSPLLGQTFEDLFLYAESNIVIEVGSLDGTDEVANQSLSNERAQAIRAFLIERGIDGERLVISLLPDAGESATQQYLNIQANL